MSFRGAPCIAFCLDPHCDRSFEWIRDEQHGGVLDDALNCIPPKDKPTEEEREELEEY